jgi:phosphotransferase system  glucose/maltose/N-acetylglucosamine-specific IIC component
MTEPTKGHSANLALFLAVGIAVGAAIDNVGLGIALGFIFTALQAHRSKG